MVWPQTFVRFNVLSWLCNIFILEATKTKLAKLTQINLDSLLQQTQYTFIQSIANYINVHTDKLYTETILVIYFQSKKHGINIISNVLIAYSLHSNIQLYIAV